jgi:uncharacterized small protein (DUF1192 family)
MEMKMFHDEDGAASTSKQNVITPGEDLSDYSIEALAERRGLLELEIQRIDEITDKKHAGRSEAEAIFKI